MSDPTLVHALETARGAREEAAGEVARLRAELQAAADHLAGLDNVIDAIESFLDGASSQKNPDGTPGETANGTADSVPSGAPRILRIEAPTTIRKKYPSTRMVGELVNELGRPIHRDEVLGAFEEKFGIPSTWDNPRNTLGNALLRAWERGTIQRLDQHYFAPRNYAGAIPDGGQ